MVICCSPRGRLNRRAILSAQIGTRAAVPAVAAVAVVVVVVVVAAAAAAVAVVVVVVAVVVVVVAAVVVVVVVVAVVVVVVVVAISRLHSKRGGQSPPLTHEARPREAAQTHRGGRK
ncbi:unnamed protein product [Boreogadus saida]